MTIEALSFSQEQVSNMMHFNRALTDIKELEDMGDSAIEFKRIAFDYYFTATRTLTPDGYLRDNRVIKLADEIMVERGINVKP